jgi:hypothetical protein
MASMTTPMTSVYPAPAPSSGGQDRLARIGYARQAVLYGESNLAGEATGG